MALVSVFRSAGPAILSGLRLAIVLCAVSCCVAVAAQTTPSAPSAPPATSPKTAQTHAKSSRKRVHRVHSVKHSVHRSARRRRAISRINTVKANKAIKATKTIEPAKTTKTIETAKTSETIKTIKTTKTHRARKSAKNHKHDQVALAPIPPPPPPPPDWPADDKPQPASVAWNGRDLTIAATNASLQQILNEVSTATGVKVEGAESDQRIFGSYGPASAREVLSQLLDGSGYNVLIVGDKGEGTPRELVLTARTHIASIPAANSQSRQNADDDAQEEPEQPEPTNVIQHRPFAVQPGQGRSPEQLQEEQQQRQEQRQEQLQQQQPPPPKD